MSRIIKKAVVGCEGYSDYAELTIEQDGKIVYIATSDMGEEGAYFVSEKSMADFEGGVDEAADQPWVTQIGDTGLIDEFKGEEELSKSEYYGCCKYLAKLISDCRAEEHSSAYFDYEVTTDYGKDIDKMDLPPIASFYEDE